MLTTDERNEALVSYQDKCKNLSDHTLACIHGTQTGMLLFGAGGNGKSFSIREVFKKQAIHEITPEERAKAMSADDEDIVDFGYKTWVNHQGRITPKGLVEELCLFPNSIHLVEDAETMFDDKNCWGVLRMALHSQDHSQHPKRRITWKVSNSGKNKSFDFDFRGSIILVGNRTLKPNNPEIDAVKTRCACMQFNVSDNELIAMMLDICMKGYDGIPGMSLTPMECEEVLTFILNVRDSDKRLKNTGLNMRILILGFRHFLLQKIEPAVTNWRSLVSSQMKELVGGTDGKVKRSDRVASEAEQAVETSKMKFKSELEKLLHFAKLINLTIDPVSPEFKKNIEALKKRYSRSLRRA